jgi:hypothetical protein
VFAARMMEVKRGSCPGESLLKKSMIREISGKEK